METKLQIKQALLTSSLRGASQLADEISPIRQQPLKVAEYLRRLQILLHWLQDESIAMAREPTSKAKCQLPIKEAIWFLNQTHLYFDLINPYIWEKLVKIRTILIECDNLLHEDWELQPEPL